MKETPDLDALDPKNFIVIKGARVHNLKNLNVAIPRNKLIVITGLSGSGKSSLAFDTLYAEGQRRYVESLSAYARQFLGRITKPDVDSIKGISPAIAIEQKVISRNPRSTVGTSTEIYDYLKLLYARIGKTFSPISGNQVKRDSVRDILNFINALKEGTRFYILAPLKIHKEKSLQEQLQLLLQQGFTRVKIKNELVSLEDINLKKISKNEPVQILIDRLTVQKGNDSHDSRIADSLETAFFEGNGECIIEIDNIQKSFSNRFELDGITFEEPSNHFFSFNNPVGACKTCEGFGSVMGIDRNLVIPDVNKSIFDDAIVCWKGEKMQEWKKNFIKQSHSIHFPIHKPYKELQQKHIEILWQGNKGILGLNDFFKMLEEQSYKIQYRVLLARYRGKTTCPDCLGSRLRKDANYVKINNKSIIDLVLDPVVQNLHFFENISLSTFEQDVASRLLIEIKSRLRFLVEVGLGYLTLNRLSNSLSGGESQRINLATSLGSSLVGSLYVLDEPSIGLHSRDTALLIKVLIGLRDLGNTVIIVEHDEEIMRVADQLIDIGPLAGSKGGELVFQGQPGTITLHHKSITANYLSGKDYIAIPPRRRISNDYIEVTNASTNNLKNINVKFPLHLLTVITGVSGSGKSTLVKKVLLPKLSQFESLPYSIDSVEFIDQNPIGKSSRSNPVTFLKAYDDIRTLFAEQGLAKHRGYKPSHFSFNVDGGRCDTCKGDGEVQIEMQFMADINLICESCGGKRFKNEVLEITLRNKSIYDILNLTVDDAISYFLETNQTIEKRIVSKIQPLVEVGLGYLKLGQSSNTLSGGELQRIKLASYLGQGSSQNKHLLFIFDEPTTGLHFHDIKKLLLAFNALINQGHSILVIEHNIEVIKCADWVIDLGPEGGENGGNIIFEGTPENLLKCEHSYTGQYLKSKFPQPLHED